jgi:hypothetical protein
LQLNAANFGTRRDVLHRQAIAWDWSSICTIVNHLSGFEAVRCDHIRFVPVFVVEQRNASAPIWIVLHGIDFGRYAVAISLEVDHPVEAFMPTTPMSNRDLPLVIASTMSLESLHQRLLWLRTLRQFSEIANRRVAAAGGGGLVNSNSHRMATCVGRRQKSPNLILLSQMDCEI